MNRTKREELLRRRHQLDQLEAKIAADHWRQAVSCGRFAVVSGVCATVLIGMVDNCLLPGLFVVGLVAMDVGQFVVHTLRMRCRLGCWPWRIGR